MSNLNNPDLNIRVVADQGALGAFKSDVLKAIDILEKEKVNLKIESPNYSAVVADINKLKSAYIGVENAAGLAGKSFDGARMAKALSEANRSIVTLKDSTGAAQSAVNSLAKSYDNLKTAVKNQDGMINTAAQSMSHYRKEIGVVDKALNTLGKTMLWSSANKVFDSMIQGAQDAVQHIYKLDESLNQIRLVSGMTSSEVANLAVEANKSARALGQTTVSYTDAAMLYLQQGKSLLESQKMAEATMVATNITGEKSTKVVELMTAAMNGFNYSSDRAMEVLDKFAAVGAATASDFNELATGFSKVASMANTAEVSFDQLNSMIATVSSATREAPETIGTSFKTIFARLQGLKQGEDEDGNKVDMAELGRYAQQIKDATGINFFNEQTGQIREAGELIEEIGNAWQDMSKNTKTIVAEAAAGQRQASRLHALFNSWDEYQDTLTVSLEAEGTAMEQNAVRMDSLQAASNRLKASFEALYDSVLDRDTFATLTNTLASAVDVMTRLTDATGGFRGILMSIAPIIASLALPKVMTSFQGMMKPVGKMDALSQRRTATIQDGTFANNRLSGVPLGAFGRVANRFSQGVKETGESKKTYAKANGIEDPETVDTNSKEFKEFHKKGQRAKYIEEARGIEDTTVLSEIMNIPHEEAARMQADLKRQQKLRDSQTELASKRALLSETLTATPVQRQEDGSFTVDPRLSQKETDNRLVRDTREDMLNVDKDGNLLTAQGSERQKALLSKMQMGREIGNLTTEELGGEDAIEALLAKHFTTTESGDNNREQWKEQILAQLEENELSREINGRTASEFGGEEAIEKLIQKRIEGSENPEEDREKWKSRINSTFDRNQKDLDSGKRGAIVNPEEERVRHQEELIALKEEKQRKLHEIKTSTSSEKKGNSEASKLEIQAQEAKVKLLKAQISGDEKALKDIVKEAEDNLKESEKIEGALYKEEKKVLEDRAKKFAESAKGTTNDHFDNEKKLANRNNKELVRAEEDLHAQKISAIEEQYRESINAAKQDKANAKDVLLKNKSGNSPEAQEIRAKQAAIDSDLAEEKRALAEAKEVAIRAEEDLNRENLRALRDAHNESIAQIKEAEDAAKEAHQAALDNYAAQKRVHEEQKEQALAKIGEDKKSKMASLEEQKAELESKKAQLKNGDELAKASTDLGVAPENVAQVLKEEKARLKALQAAKASKEANTLNHSKEDYESVLPVEYDELMNAPLTGPKDKRFAKVNLTQEDLSEESVKAAEEWMKENGESNSKAKGFAQEKRRYEAILATKAFEQARSGVSNVVEKGTENISKEPLSHGVAFDKVKNHTNTAISSRLLAGKEIKGLKHSTPSVEELREKLENMGVVYEPEVLEPSFVQKFDSSGINNQDRLALSREPNKRGPQSSLEDIEDYSTKSLEEMEKEALEKIAQLEAVKTNLKTREALLQEIEEGERALQEQEEDILNTYGAEAQSVESAYEGAMSAEEEALAKSSADKTEILEIARMERESADKAYEVGRDEEKDRNVQSKRDIKDSNRAAAAQAELEAEQKSAELESERQAIFENLSISYDEQKAALKAIEEREEEAKETRRIALEEEKSRHKTEGRNISDDHEAKLAELEEARKNALSEVVDEEAAALGQIETQYQERIAAMKESYRASQEHIDNSSELLLDSEEAQKRLDELEQSVAEEIEKIKEAQAKRAEEIERNALEARLEIESQYARDVANENEASREALANSAPERASSDSQGAREIEQVLAGVNSQEEAQNELNATEEQLDILGATLEQIDGAVDEVGEGMERTFNADMVGSMTQMIGSATVAAVQLVNTVQRMADTDNGFDMAKESANGLLGAVAAIGPAFGAIGMAASGVALMLMPVVDSFIDWLDALKRVEATNAKVLEQYNKQKEALNSELTAVKSVAKAYADITSEIEAAGGMHLAQDDQIAKYVDVQNQIAELDRTTVAYYDNAGNAVLKHNVDLDAQIEKTEELLLQQEEMLISNRANFFKESIISAERADEIVTKYTQKIANLKEEMNELDPTSDKYFSKLEDLNEYESRLGDAQKVLSDGSQNIQKNVIDPLLKTNKLLSGSRDELKGFAGELIGLEAIGGHAEMLKDAADRAKELGFSAKDMKDYMLDAQGQAKQLDAFVRAQEVHVQNLQTAFTALDTEEGKELYLNLINADEATKSYIGTLSSLAQSAEGVTIMLREMGGALNSFGVISTSYNPSSSLLSAARADITAINEELKKAGGNDWETTLDKALNPQNHRTEVVAAPGMEAAAAQGMMPTTTRVSAEVGRTVLMGEAAQAGVAQQNAAREQSEAIRNQKAQELLDLQVKLNEAKAVETQILENQEALEFRMNEARSNYYLNLAKTESGHNALAATYEQDYANLSPLMGSMYSTTEQSKYDQNRSMGISMNEEEEAIAREEVVEITTKTDFGDVVEQFDDVIDTLKISGEDLGESLVDELAAAMDGGIEAVETGMDALAELLRGEGMIEALAGTSEELTAHLKEFSEKGAEASVEATQATMEAVDDAKQAMGEMYAAMNADNQVYWQQVVQLNQNEVDLTTATTGIKVQDYQTYAEYKAAMQQWEAENASWLANESVAAAVWSTNEQILADAHKQAEVLRSQGDIEGANDIMQKAMVQTAETAENAKVGAAWHGAAGIVEAGGQALQIVSQAIQDTFSGLFSIPIVGPVLQGALGKIVSKGQDFANNLAEGMRLQGDAKASETGDWEFSSGAGSLPPVSTDVNLLPGSGHAPSYGGSAPTPNTSMGGSNSPSSGGGDSGGKDKEAAAKEQEDMEWEKDWYHDINILIKKNQDALTKLSDIQDRTYGEQRLKNMREQATLLQNEYELKKQALAIAKEEAAYYKSKISSSGVSFNEDGSVKDYNAFIQGKVNAANSIADADAKKEAQEAVKDLIDDIKKYEDVLFGTIKDYEDEIEKARQEAQDKILEALEYEFEIVIKVKQVIIDDNDFLNEFLEGIDTAGDILGRLTESGTSQLKVLSDLGDKFKEITELDLDPGPKIEKLEEVKAELLEAFTTLKDMNEAISQAIVDSIEKNIDALDYAFAELSAITSSAQSMIELNSLFGHGEDYEAINEMMDVIAQANELQIASMVTAKEELVSLRDALEEGTDEWKAANDAVLEMDQNIRDMTVETIKLYQEQLTNAFNGIMRDIEKAMSGGTSLDKLRKEIALTREEQARYADVIDQTLFKQKMLAQIEKDIANTTDPKKQQKLQEFYEKQVETLGEKGQLLESELQRTEMLYNITLAQMALDDARNNKSIMKLTRDDQGNWSYQYMADMAAVQAAQDNLSQQLANLMDYDKQQFEATQDYVLQKREEYLANMQELHAMYLNGEFESEAEYQAAMDALTQEFNDQQLQLEMDYNDLKLNVNESTLSALMGTYIDFSGSSEEIWGQMYEALNGMTAEQLQILEENFGFSLDAIKNASDEKLPLIQTAFLSMFTNLGTMTKQELEQMGKEFSTLFKNLDKMTPDEAIKQEKHWNDLYTKINASTTGGLGTLEKSWGDMRAAIEKNITSPETGVNKYLQDYANKVDAIAKLTGYDDLKNSSNGLKNASSQLSSQLDVEKKKHEDLHAAMKKEFDQIRDAVKSGGPLDQLRKAYENIRREIETYISKLNEAINKQQQIGNSKPTTGTAGNGSSSSGSGSSSGSTTPPKKFPGDSNNNGVPDIGEKVRLKAGRRWYHDSAGMNPSGTVWSDQDLQITLNQKGAKYPYNVGTKAGNYLGWIKQDDIVGFESGGYLTGGFGNQGGADGKNGKLAMLHEKELVLNRQDTANMLQMINMTRDFFKAPSLDIAGAGAGLQQVVNINADFSGVRNSAEIEDAFANLVNKAIQYTK